MADTPADRLTKAKDKAGRSIRSLQRELHEAGVPGSSYANVYAYFKGRTTPSLEFLDAAARSLGVRAAWLAFGEEPQVEVPEGQRILLEKLSEDAAYQLAPLVEDKRAVIEAFHGAMRRLCDSVGSPHDEDTDGALTDEDVTRIAELLVKVVREPFQRLHHNLPLGSRQVQDHYVGVLHALMLVMPMYRSVDSAETIISKLEGTDATD